MAAAQSISNPASTAPVISLSRNKSKPSSSSSFLKPYSLQSPWLGIKLSLQSSKPRPHLPNYRPITATSISSLPTSKTDRFASTEKVPKWSRRAIKSFCMAELEARKLKYETTGTEALLMGILIEGTSLAAKFLRANGITLFKVREESVKLLEKGDLFSISPERPPLTEHAQRALDWAVDQKLKSADDGEITTTHLLLGIWSEVESPGHKIMAALGFNDAKAKELTSLSSEPESVDGFPS
ncbi:ATP-dependent Clp protease ATP-binding subunit CLPT2, chloroplastic [Durio zibethinus]|uniref:ATP-dependent Clp protease ATP-binding subunit CLPT2, chloroplastic n=1 Tax=Durio zibethinus TaxID=66656 RepID=A0A6P5YBZ1_DURZI|nr:ATP-dependent Clp protease ATP-binding subunit CLPT2, chloroplastic [Durio zibethinus]